MERPAKRQKLSEEALYAPTRTLNLADFQRPQYVRRNIEQKLGPRRPDVTVSAAIVEVNVNDASTAVQVSVSTGDVAVTLSGLGTLTVPAVDEPTSSASTTSGSSRSSASESSQETGLGSTTSSLTTTGALFPSANSTSFESSITSTERTVTVTATSTFHVSYHNGTFIVPTTTSHHKTASTGTNSDDDDSSSDSNSDSATYVFGQGVTGTYSQADATGTMTGGTAYNNNGAAAATGTNSKPSSSSSSDSGSGGGGSGIAPLTPQQTQMVGGIVGGVAGIAFVLVIILYVLRWYRQRLKLQGRLPNELADTNHSFHGKAALAGMAAPISQRSLNQSRTSLFAATGAAKKWRGSDMTFLTDSTSHTAGDSEKGFQRVSGRKIPSVLTHGGDQYGGSYGAFEKEIAPLTQARSFTPQKHRHDLSESSFYRDEEGMHIGTGSRSAPSSPIYPAVFTKPRRPSQPSPSVKSPTSRRDFGADDFDRAFNQNMAGMSKPDGFAISRNSPARTPVIQSPTTSSLRLPIQAPVTMDSDVPEMPLPSPGLMLGQGQGNALGHDLGRQRMPSRMSARSGSSSTRFREDLS